MENMRELGCAVCAVLALAALTSNAAAGTIIPTSYDMPNGSSDGYGYFDDTYSGSGDPTVGNSALSGGLGDLTDGVVASLNFDDVEAAGVAGPYVGWRFQDVSIVFNFGGTVNMDAVTVHVDDSTDYGHVTPPEAITISMGGVSRMFSITDPATNVPLALEFSGLSLAGDSLTLTLEYSWEWTMVSEVEFDGVRTNANAVPLPLGGWLGLGLLGLLGAIRKRRQPPR